MKIIRQLRNSNYQLTNQQKKNEFYKKKNVFRKLKKFIQFRIN